MTTANEAEMAAEAFADAAQSGPHQSAEVWHYRKTAFMAGVVFERRRQESEPRPVLNLLSDYKERLVAMEKEREFYKAWANPVLEFNSIYQKEKEARGYE